MKHAICEHNKSQFKEGDVIKVNSASSGIGVTKDDVKECWINP